MILLMTKQEYMERKKIWGKYKKEEGVKGIFVGNMVYGGNRQKARVFNFVLFPP